MERDVVLRTLGLRVFALLPVVGGTGGQHGAADGGHEAHDA